MINSEVFDSEVFNSEVLNFEMCNYEVFISEVFNSEVFRSGGSSSWRFCSSRELPGLFPVPVRILRSETNAA